MCQVTPQTQCELPVSLEAPRMARAFLREATCTDHSSHVLDDAVLLVSELVTNSVKHGGPPVVVAVECDGEALRVRVRDGSPASPTPRSAEWDEETGRGLALVESLSAAWGVDADGDGKHVWFTIR